MGMEDGSLDEQDRGRVRSHRDLEVWHRAIELAVIVYRVTDSMPKSETYGLTSQIRRAAASVAANIAEGSARRTTKDLMQFLAIASGSLREVDTYVEIIQRLQMPVETEALRHKIDEVGRLLAGLFRSLSSRV